MTGREVARRLKVSEVAASTPRVGLLARLTALYGRRKVMTRDGQCCPLDQCCDSAAVCWRTAKASDHPGHKDSDPREPDGSIFWPWIGEHYVPGGLCVVAINLNLDTDEPEQDWWELTVEYGISARTGEYLGAGLYSNPLWPPSKTGYRMVASAAAILTAGNGIRPPSDVEPDPRAVVGFLEHSARVQTIKCSPRDRAAGQPTSAMWRQCPPRYLSGELAILRPGTLLVFGTGPWDAMNAIGEVALEVDESVFSYGTFTAGALNADLFWLPHPNNRRGGWALGQRRLLDRLSRML